MNYYFILTIALRNSRVEYLNEMQFVITYNKWNMFIGICLVTIVMHDLTAQQFV